MNLLVNSVQLQTLFNVLSNQSEVCHQARFCTVAWSCYTTKQILITWGGLAFNYCKEPYNPNIKQYFTIKACHSVWKGCKFSQIDDEKNEETKRSHAIGVHFHFLMKIYKAFFWRFLFGVLLLWLVLTVFGWLVLYVQCGLASAFVTLERMVLRCSKTQCFNAFLKLEKIPEALKSLYSRGLYPSTTGQENELVKCHFRKTEVWKECSVRLT